MTLALSHPLALPCGVVLPNRLAKAAMSEGLADFDNHATPRLETLYRRWADSGVGLMLSGNIQVDRQHLERPNNIVADDESGLAQLSALASAGTSQGGQFWAQLSHTGRQVSSHINPCPLSSSDVEIDIAPGLGRSFAKPRAMTEAEIEHAVGQFAFAARQVRKAGFTGVSLHAAHGYLISQFLSPLSNPRADRWGGSLENRSRLLMAVIAAVRAAVGPGFPIGIKLNASDFQKGGFTNAECIELVRTLNGAGLDLLELSGGSLEQPKIAGITLKDEGEDAPRPSTIAREAYFVAFAGEVRRAAAMPVMVTGGFRSAAAMIQALDEGELDIVGIGRPMIVDPQAPRRLLGGQIDRLPSFEARLNVFHLMPWHNMQIERLGDGLDPDLTMTGETALAGFVELETQNLKGLLSRRAAAAAAAG